MEDKIPVITTEELSEMIRDLPDHVILSISIEGDENGCEKEPV